MEAKLIQVKPKPTVSWYRDGKPLESDDHWRLSESDDGTLQLKIISTELTDKSRITIKAENKWGSAECSASIGVTKKRMQSKPAFQSDLAPITLNEGDSLKTKLIVTGDPEPYAKWYINNQMVYPTEDTEIKNENGVYSLTIHGVTTDMTGKIKCTIGNRMGEATTEGQLTVIQPIPVAFETVLCDATCREGDTLKLKAVLLGEPMPDVTWFVNGRKLEETQNIKIHAEKGTYTVTIKDITCDYSGKVVCEAVNEFGKASSEAMLLVLPRGEPPDFLEWLSNVRARQGSKVVHKVVFTGDPKPNLTWYINNKEVTHSEEISIVTDATTSILTINNFNPEKHVGEIICKAENEAGEVSCTANMGTYTSDMFSESESEAMAEENLEFEELTETGTDHEEEEEIARTPTPIMAPKFITKIKDTKAKKGHQAIFECVVPDTKGVCCKWLKDGKEIELIARIRVQTRTIEGHTTNELIIDEVIPEDAGKYTVIVENRAGTDTCEATLQVVEMLEKPEDKQPEFVVQLKDKSVKATEKVTFECKVVGTPEPHVSWYHGDEKLEEIPKKVIIEADDSVHRLVIESTEVKDEGTYSCVAENSAGTTKSEATLQVLSEPPSFTKSLQDKSVKMGDKIILDCSVKGVPQPLVEFYHESTRITSSSRVTVEHDASNTHWRIAIKDSTREDFRKYRAEAKNAAGTAISEATVTGQQVPVFEQGLKKTTVSEKETIRMEVKVNGFPNPELKWFKDGSQVIPDGTRIIIKEETLIINESRIEDSGTYTVEATNSAGKESSTAPVTVEPLSESPKFTEGLKSVSIKESETAEMSVTVSGKPEPEVTWYKDSKPVQVDGTHFIEKKDTAGHHTLIIKDATTQDIGTYSCKATNPAGSAETSASVNVEVQNEPPKFTEVLKSVSIKETESTELSVTVSGKPEPEIKWFKDSQPVQVDGTHFIEKKDTVGHHTLTIRDARQEDIGTYSCRATNVAGSAECSASVDVEIATEGPKFTETLKSVSIKETEFTTLSVTVTGKPEPQISWFKDDQPIQIDGTHFIEKKVSIGQHTLTIRDARLTDLGTYSCKATNVAGSAETTATVTVLDKMTAPEFTKKLVPIQVKESQSAKFEVTVTGKPEPNISWYKDDQPVQADGTHIMARKDDKGQYSLVISNAGIEDVGVYSCRAVNESGMAETKASFGVQEDLEAPEFTESLKPLEVKESTTAEMSVTVSGKPEPEITWFKDGSLVQIDGSHILEHKDASGHHTLVIKDARMQDAGTYSCKATNKAGSAETKASFGVQEVVEAPHFTEALMESEVAQGEEAKLECTVVGKPAPEIVWKKDGVPVNVDQSHIISKKDEQGHQVLVIKNVASEDVGTYSCEAVNKAGKAETSAPLKFPKYGFERPEEGVIKPFFVEPLKSTEAVEGDTVILECRVNKESAPEVRWFHNSQEIVPGPNVVIEKLDDGTLRLKIQKTTHEDLGAYKCEAVNKAGKADTQAKLDLKHGEEKEAKITEEEVKPMFIEPLHETTVTEGSTVTMECIVNEASHPTIQWFKDEKPVQLGDHVLVEQTDDGKLKITIQNATKEDVGSYRCEAVNKAGTATTSAALKLQYAEEKTVEHAEEGVVEEIGALEQAPEEVVAESLAGDSEAKEKAIGRCPPEFVELLRSATSNVGGTAVLKCKVKGEPRPKLKWTKDGKEVEMSARITTTYAEDGSIELKVENVTKNDDGEYRCEASNELGTAWTEGPITVADEGALPSEGEAPDFLQPVRPVTVTEGETAVLEGKISGKPEPKVKWYKNQVELKPDDRVKIESLPDGTQKLTIKNATMADMDEYRCEASNDYGDVWSDVTLTVKVAQVTEPFDKAQVAPTFVKTLEEVRATEGDHVEMECKIVGEPMPEIRWYKDKEEISSTDAHFHQTTKNDGTARLTIDSVELADAGEYRCEAKNPAGTARTEAPMKVATAGEEPLLTEIAPEFAKELKAVQAKEDEEAVFECKISGMPQPQVKWFKDGEELKPGDGIVIEVLDDGTNRLKIQNAKVDDQGNYRVEATNNAGSMSSKAPLSVTGTITPYEILPNLPIPAAEKLKLKKGLEDQKVVVGARIRLSIEVEGKPKTVKWFKGTEEVVISSLTKIEKVTDEEYKLEIEKSQLSDGGAYRVVLSTDTESIESSCQVTVTSGDVKPSFAKGLEDETVPKGSALVLEIEVDGKPKQVKWFMNGSPVDESRAKVEDLGNGKYRLTIPEMGDSDFGDYSVTVSNDAGEVSSKAKVTVAEGKPELVSGLAPTTVKEGEDVKFEVKTKGPVKQVKWYKNGDEIKDAETKDLGNGTYQLLIPSAKKSDAAEYKVVLSNDAGSVDSSAGLKVEESKPKEEPKEEKAAKEPLGFVKGLEDQTVKPGDKAVLEVQTNGKPKQVKWYKNGKEISPSDHAEPKQVSDAIYQLVIPDATKDDSADYKIVVTDDDGVSADSSCALTVKLPGKISIVKGLEDQTVPPGVKVILEVEVDRAPKQVKWYKNGKEIAPSDKAKPKKADEKRFQLEIPDIVIEDMSDYKVVLTDDDDNTADSYCALTVKLPAKKLGFEKGLEDQIAKPGDKVVLEVETTGKPKQVKWYKNGKEIAPSDKVEPKQVSDTIYQLVIPDTTEDDAADFKVVIADDDDNTADSSCALTVKLPAEQPKFVKGLEDVFIPIGSPLNLEIKTSGSPKIVRWYKNGQEVSPDASAKVKLNKIDDNNYSLTIDKSEVADSGTYQVEIENDAGKAKTIGDVTVEVPIEFLKPLKDVEVKEGEQATFEVETNTKVRKVTWYRNGQEIKTDSRVVTRSEETKYKLLIKSSLKEDAGTYKIVLCNSCGEVDSEAKLTVKKAKGDEPKILKGLEDQVVAKGADLIFEVKVQGEDLELKWFKDGSPVSADAKIEKIDEQTYRLTIPTADLKDAGQYSVDASNDAGKAKSSASGEVDEVPEIVKELEDAEISQDDDQLFRVEVSAPVRQVKWYKNGQEVKPLGNVAQKQVNPKKYELTISKAQMDNAGTFKVVLSNAAGSCESSAQLTVVKPNILKVLKGLQDVTVNDGEPIELSCKVEGTPKTVKWYKNGQEIKPDDRIKMEENPANGEFCLKIPEATASDGAAYRIVLTNDRGEVYSGAVAHVRAKKPEAEAKPANFVSPLSDIEIPEGDTLTLKCQVAGQPEPEVKWFCDGKELTKDDRVTIRLAFDGTATLRIRDTKKSDAGEYHVVASNEAGSSESRCKVGVISAEELPESPKFVIPLRTQGAFPGSKAEFTVKVRGVPKPTLTFYLNGSPVDLNDPRFVLDDMADGNFTLTINEVKEEDYGTIRCVAQNDNGKDECEAKFLESKDKPEKIKDDEGYPPKFNVPLWDRRIPEDQPLSIECHVDAKPVADIRWTKDGELLQESENVEIWNTPDGACRVKINRFTQFDIGVYKCQAKNCHGVADTRANYNVEVEMVEEKVERKEYPPRFNPQLSDVNVSAGNTISLSCGVDAVPTATVVWYKDGLPIKLDGRVEAEYDEKSGQCRLTIRDAKDSDDGAYRCVATNEHGTTNTACLVGVKSVKEEVKKEGEEPFFTKGLVDTWTERGETITLKCAVTGDPRPEIKWYRNGILLRDSNRVSLEYAPDGTCTCVVKECSLSDEGIYRCEAENSLGKAKTQATAHIEMGRSKTDKVKLPEGEAPRFVIPLEDMTVTQGSSLELECKVAGQPMPQVKWAKDGAPVWDDPRYEWTTDAAAGTYRLYIREATVYDEGTYRCVATNDSGQATTKAYVKIDDGTYGGVPKESAMTPPRFTLHLGDARATEGQPLKLEAKIEANPLPELTWYKDGEKVLPSDRVTMEMDPDGTARLIIPKCSMDDDGLYRVIATNPAGSAHDKANATVKRAPAGVIENGLPEEDFQANKAPKVIIPLENVKVPEKQRISLRCKFSGDPKPAIKWFKDGERVYAFGRCQMTEDDDGNCELTIDSAGRMDNGCYRCVAENIYGSARTMCEVVVQLKERKPRDFEAELKEGNAPGFSVPLTVKRAKPGDTVTFECVPYGNPFPTIKWMKDGIELNPSSTVKMEVSDDGLQRLILSDIDFFSEGFYRCVATNEYGTASTKAELSVAGMCFTRTVF
ncbi:hypothetical protein L596_010016 [Steinernema carpocapsae]|nr:hypothetical protein L596_010016 [Steinernema carpocapsae]